MTDNTCCFFSAVLGHSLEEILLEGWIQRVLFPLRFLLDGGGRVWM